MDFPRGAYWQGVGMGQEVIWDQYDWHHGRGHDEWVGTMEANWGFIGGRYRGWRVNVVGSGSWLCVNGLASLMW